MKIPLNSKDFYFDRQAANRAVRFFETVLVHSKGEWAGQAFKLQRWQKKIVKDIFGWKRRRDGTRRYKTVYIEVPKKNGKSTLAAGMALYLLCADGEPGAEVYSAACDKEQAAIVFEIAKKMVETSTKLAKLTESYRRSIVVPSTGSSYKVLSADVPTKHGINPHGIIFDELHAQPNRELWDTLTTAPGARRQPLTVAITTAGYDKNSICWEIHEYAQKVLEGTIRDDSFYAVIFAADKDDDWKDPKTWRKANPNFGVTVKKEFLKEQLKKALESPAYQNTFRRLFLNQWTEQAERWIEMDTWNACIGKIDREELGGRECYAGLDLASTIDIAAFVMVFPPVEEEENYKVLPFFWIPEENIRERSLKDKVPYDVWAREGLIEATEGNVIDYASIRQKIKELGETVNIKEIAYDRWGATQISQDLQGMGFTVVPFGQGFASMSPPTKELLNLLMAKKIEHGGNEVLTWMASNMAVKQDPAGNIKPDKSKSSEKIDGIVALIMGLDRAIRHQGKGGSIYEERGILVL